MNLKDLFKTLLGHFNSFQIPQPYVVVIDI